MILNPFIFRPCEYTDAEYRQMEGISHSDLQLAYTNPEAYMMARDMGPLPPSDAQSFGTAFHTALLRPLEFGSHYHILDDTDIIQQIGGAKPRATNKYKAWYEEEVGLAQGKAIITREDASAINSMLYRIYQRFPWLDGTVTEKVITRTDVVPGLLTKVMVDFPTVESPYGQLVLDVKTVGLDQLNRPYLPMNGEKTGEHLLEMGYATQRLWQSMHIDDSGSLTQATLCILKEPPYTPYLVVHGQLVIAEAKHRLERMRQWFIKYTAPNRPAIVTLA